MKEQQNILPAGGQAVIEGVMMMSPNHMAIAVRNPQNKIIVTTQKVFPLVKKSKILGLPFIRGVIHLFQMMYIGTKALNYSANIAMQEEGKEEELGWFSVTLSIFLALIFGIFMFKFIPLLIAKGFSYMFETVASNKFLYNFIDGIFKIMIFIGYILAISQLKDIKRVFQYHGAEHMAVNCYEARKKLTVANVRKFTTRHPRCGTSFIVFVLIISMLTYAVIPLNFSFLAQFGLRILLLPVIAGLSYEILKLTARYSSNRIVSKLIMPGLWFQGLTTRIPDDKQIAVSVTALKAALKAEGKKYVL